MVSLLLCTSSNLRPSLIPLFSSSLRGSVRPFDPWTLSVSETERLWTSRVTPWVAGPDPELRRHLERGGVKPLNYRGHRRGPDRGGRRSQRNRSGRREPTSWKPTVVHTVPPFHGVYVTPGGTTPRLPPSTNVVRSGGGVRISVHRDPGPYWRNRILAQVGSGLLLLVSRLVDFPFTSGCTFTHLVNRRPSVGHQHQPEVRWSGITPFTLYHLTVRCQPGDLSGWWQTLLTGKYLSDTYIILFLRELLGRLENFLFKRCRSERSTFLQRLYTISIF